MNVVDRNTLYLKGIFDVDGLFPRLKNSRSFVIRE
jgi:hypothetical protein